MPAPLDGLRIARPCSADWEAMAGAGPARHCALCDKTVHDLSALTSAEAVAVAGGAGCVRVRRDRLGRVVTAEHDAPPSTPQRAVMAAALAAVLAVSAVAADRLHDALRAVAPAWAGGADELVTMGEMAPPDDGLIGDAVLLPPAPPPPAW